MDMHRVMEKWLEVSKTRRHPNTLKMHYEPFVKVYLKAVGNHEINEFSLEHVDQFIAYLREEGLNEVSTNMKLQRLKTFLNWAYDRGFIDKVPRFSKLREPLKLPSILSLEELERLFHRLAMLQEKADNNYLRRCFRLHERALMVLLATGMRRAEVFYLRWDYVDFGRKCIHVRHQENFIVKEKKEKRVDCPDYLLAYLLEQKKLFPKEIYLLDDGHGEILYKSPHGLTQAFNRHYKTLGWKARSIKPLHGFRALFIDRLFNTLNIELDVVSGMVGHSSTKVTKLYLSNTDRRHRNVAKKLDTYDKRILDENNPFLRKKGI
ncbi:site-specific integrase [Deltaproteobacteria bacterium TL4]